MLKKNDLIAQGYEDSLQDSCGMDIYTDGKNRRALVDKKTGEVMLTYRKD